VLSSQDGLLTIELLLELNANVHAADDLVLRMTSGFGHFDVVKLLSC